MDINFVFIEADDGDVNLINLSNISNVITTAKGNLHVYVKEGESYRLNMTMNDFKEQLIEHYKTIDTLSKF